MHSSSSEEIAVVGAGVIGLACAATLARRGHSVIVLESADGVGRETTARNSEVIHAGIYYPPGSLKAALCVQGRQLLYQRCRLHGIGHRRTGKLIVATAEDEVERLENIASNARSNGAGAIEIFDAAKVRALEPRVQAFAAVWSPETGIVDSHGLTLSYQAELEAHGGSIAFRTSVVAAQTTHAGWKLETQDGTELETSHVINAAGLHGAEVARLAGLQYTMHYCKGDYFSVAPSLGKLTEHLVYPVPVQAGLGIHITMDLGGRYRLGPDTEYIDELHYQVDPDKAERFAAAARRYLPEIKASDLAPDFAGIRPKLQGPDQGFHDFVIAEESSNGAPGWINLLGIESPGLTASEAIAMRVVDLLR